MEASVELRYVLEQRTAAGVWEPVAKWKDGASAGPVYGPPGRRDLSASAAEMNCRRKATGIPTRLVVYGNEEDSR